MEILCIASTICEYNAKLLVAHFLGQAPRFGKECPTCPEFRAPEVKVTQIAWDAESKSITADSSLPPWVFTEKLVVKPDQLIKRRGNSGLLGLNDNKTWPQAKAWVQERAGKAVNVKGIVGTLNTFIVKPFAPYCRAFCATPFGHRVICLHPLCAKGNMILFTHDGRVDIGDVDAKVAKITDLPTRAQLKARLLAAVPPHCQDALVDFLVRLYLTYVDLHYNYLKLTPLCAIDRETSVAANGSKTFADRGPPMVFAAPFGRDLTKEEAYIEKLDASTGASRRLTVLINAHDRVWTMGTGGGASVVYS
ncbi:hypothetical protein PCANC_15584 [Puccinia coronata f. sp. avenae]|uniref:ATP citrate synthase n=1 Tax=Puccinia coronata f. sp. avenae TaxID=200324 RepID=A0A2N5SKB7_9BASI|nr:hypothetical protein PCANC_15584 [Puccinia coronata f. sp. avenae]